MAIALKLKITFEAENMVSQSIVVDCPHGVPGQLLQPMNEEGIEDTLDFMRREIAAGNFAFVHQRFGKEQLVVPRKDKLNGD